MRYVHVHEFRVARDQMLEFTNGVQQWERTALTAEGGPEHHAVLRDEAEPDRVLILTQFPDAEAARAFQEGELAGSLTELIEACCESKTTSHLYSVYYAAGPDGPQSVFGLQTRPA